MKAPVCWLVVPMTRAPHRRVILFAVLLVLMPVLGLASPLPVKPVDGRSQKVLMCPACGAPIACAKAGDYTLALTADLIAPEILRYVTLKVRVTDKSGAPVNDADVVIGLLMSGHWHEITPSPTAHKQGNGIYSVTTWRLRMAGTWNAEVRLKTAGGDTVTQKFTFEMPA